MKKLGFYIACIFMGALSILPMWLLYFLSDIMYCILYYLVGYRKKVVMTNLRNSFPEKSKKEIVRIAKKFYLHLCDIGVETIALMSISPAQINKRVTYTGLEEVERFYKEGRPIIAAMGHYGNWEWGTNFSMHTDYKTLIAYKPLDDKNFDELYKRMRSRFGFIPVSMKETTRQMISRVRSGEKVLLILIADQTPAYVELHHYTTFLGQDTPVFMGPEKMAIALDAAFMFISMSKAKRGHYVVNFSTLCEHPKDTQPFELTNMQLRYLENQIRQQPEYWLWSHRRWKHKRENTQPQPNSEN